MVNKKNKKPIITEAWTGPGRKDEKITVFKPEFDAIHIDMKQRGNSEWWYFDARLDNGYTVVAFFRAKHERSGKTGVEITIYKPNDEKIQNVYEYKRSDLKASHELADVQIGKNYINVDYSNEKFPTYEVFLDEGEFGFHLKYTAEVPGWMPGKGYTKFGNIGEFGWVVPLPKAKVEGTIKVHDESISVKGIGYHDHNWITLNMIKIVNYWHWGRIYSENFTIVYAYIKCNKKMDEYIIPVLMIAKNDDIILSTGEYELIEDEFQYDDKAKNNYPLSLEFTLSEQNKISLRVENIIDSEYMLSEFNPILGFLAKNILKLTPGYFRLNSKFEINYDFNGTSFKEKGTTLHELVILKQ
ncbi:MAG: lipocalin-like domain-containing protein [Promethearchaeota archaeon]